MRVVFDRAVLGNVGAARWLTSILGLFEEGRHRWVVEDADAIVRSAWFTSEAPYIQRRIRLQVDHAEASTVGRPHVHRQVLRVAPVLALNQHEWSVPPQRAEEYLRQPVTVLVENLECDGTFFRVVMLVFGERRWRWLDEQERERLMERWRTALGDGAFFRVAHGGGGNLPDLIQVYFKHSPDLPPRLLILVDSDMLAPGARRAGTTADRCANACRALQVEQGRARYFPGYQPDLVVLQKREVENYLPFRALRRQAGEAKGRQYAAFATLDRQQQDHYDMKDGLRSSLRHRGDERLPEAPADWLWKDGHDVHQLLFANLSADAKHTLSTGFGGSVWEGLLADRGCVNRETLDERSGPELAEIVERALSLV